MRDNVARGSGNAGIGATVNIVSEEEDLLWSIDILGMSSPRVLSNTILFLTGKVFCLRGGREHYAIKLSQFTFATGLVSGEQRECVVYVENGSKNHSGSYKDKGSNKSVRHYEDPQLGERCYVSILKFYLSKLPEVLKTLIYSI